MSGINAIDAQNSWSQARVLITGAGGFIGSHLCERLVRLGARTRAFVRYTSRMNLGCLEFLPAEIRDSIEVVAGDLRDSSAVLESCRGCTHIFHLGALIGIPYSYRFPTDVIETNVIGSLNVLQAARELGTGRLIQTSTSEVYGGTMDVAITEDHPLRAQSPYAASKIAADKLAESYQMSFEVPIVTLRPFNTYGPRQSARAVIPTIITQVLNGDRVRLGNLEPVRDLTYVDDTVDGYLKAAHARRVVGETINLGTGEAVRIGDLARQIIKLMDVPIEIELDSQRVRPSNSEVGRLLNWIPTVGLEEGLRRTIDWVAGNYSFFKSHEYSV